MWGTAEIHGIQVSALHKVLVDFGDNREASRERAARTIADECVKPLLRSVNLRQEVSEIGDAEAKFRAVISRIIEDGELVDTFAYLLVDYLEKVYLILREWLAEFLKNVLTLIRENGTNLIATFWSKE
jgi:hypothetical protein